MRKTYQIGANYIDSWFGITSIEDGNEISFKHWTGWENESIYDEYLEANKYDIKYSKDKNTWTNYVADSVIDLDAGETLYLKGINTTLCGQVLPDCLNIISTKKCNVSGKISTLFTEQPDTLNNKTLSGEYDWGNGATQFSIFLGLRIEDASQLEININNVMCKWLFSKLEFRNDDQNAYAIDNTDLKYPPKLPATSLTAWCYYCMFYQCVSLLAAPVLPAITLATGCYSYMFNKCSSLITPCKLPATTLAESCYREMFENCSNLEKLPVLSALNIPNNAYGGMFYNTKIRIYTTQSEEHSNEYRIPTIGTGTVGTDSLNSMFGHDGADGWGIVISPNTTYYTSNDIIS